MAHSSGNVFTHRISMAFFCLSHTHTRTYSLNAFADTDTNISVYPLSHCSRIVKCQKAERGKCQLNRSACSPVAATHNHSRPHTHTRACTHHAHKYTHTHTTYSHLFSKHSVMHYGKGGPKAKFIHSVVEIQLHILFVFHYYYNYMYIYLYLCMSLLLYAYIKIYMDCNL